MTSVTKRAPGTTLLDRAAIGALTVALGLAFLTPPEATQGNVARFFYLHVPAVSIAYLAFAVALIGSLGYLLTRKMKFDHLAVAGAEVGVVFTGSAILAGMIWGKPTWGVYWTWSARLTLTAIMLFVYLGYLALRRLIVDPATRARRAAIYGTLSIVQIPIIHFSVVWWRDIHQLGTIASPTGIQMDGVLWLAFLAGFLAFTTVAATLTVRRYQLAGLEHRLYVVLSEGAGAFAGDAVSVPQLEATGKDP